MVDYLSQEDSGARDLVLSQLGIPDFVDSLREVLSPLRGDWRLRWGDLGRWGRKLMGNWGWSVK